MATAIGAAVLRVLREEALPQRAVETGVYLVQRLRELQVRLWGNFLCVYGVRGASAVAC